VSGIVSSSAVSIVGGVSVSGQPVTISGDHIFIESGAYLASGLYVVTGGSSGTYAASGVGVIINSGVGVIVQSGLEIIWRGVQVSGTVAVSGLVGVQSGEVHILSSQLIAKVSGEIVSVASGVYLSSGLVINISGETIILADAYIALTRAINILAKPLWYDQVTGTLRTQLLSGVVSVTGGSITATVATTIVNISGIVGFNPKDTWLNDEREIAWCLNVRQRIT
jgi:hypothetical protein